MEVELNLGHRYLSTAEERLMQMSPDEIDMLDFGSFSVYDRIALDKEARIEMLAKLLAEQLWEEERQDGAGSLAMQSAGSSTSSLPPLPAADPTPILEELLVPAVQAVHVLAETFVSMTEILAVGAFLGALGAVHDLGPRVALARLLGLTVTAPALGTPMIPNQVRSRRRRTRREWDPFPCYLCSSNEVSYFFSCCQDLVCSDCAFGQGPAMCRCTSRRRPVPHRPQHWPLPERSVFLLPHPIWQICSISDEPNFIVIRYFRPEDEFYLQATTGIRYSFHFFFMEGARWTRCISAWCTTTPGVQMARVLILEYFNHEGNN